MQQPLVVAELDTRSSSHQLTVPTGDSFQFIDLTDHIRHIVAASGITNGFVNIQTRHTTTAIIINEAEPLLLEDIRDILEKLVPTHSHYRHDDLSIRTANLIPDERVNGFAHCRAFFLRTSECVNLVDGELQLGRWQRIFLLELDGPQVRSVSLMILGH